MRGMTEYWNALITIGFADEYPPARPRVPLKNILV